MTTNQEEKLWQLHDAGALECDHADDVFRRLTIAEEAPAAIGLDRARDRARAMMLGLAIGDGLGNTSEGKLPAVRHQHHGEIRDYLPNWYADDKPVGLPSDDTQMAAWTLEQLIADQGLLPEHLSRRFTEEQIFGIGMSVKAFVGKVKQGLPWERCGAHSAGNGALMRIAPVIYPHLKRPSKDLWVDVGLATLVTHRDLAALSASVAFVRLLWELMRRTDAPAPEWWLDTFCWQSHSLDAYGRYEARDGHYKGRGGALSSFTREVVEKALESDLSVVDACNSWYSGAYLLETVPSVLYILIKHGHDPEEAIVRAVNDTKDNDTIAAIVGAAMGALHGVDALPERWRTNLLGRTAANDDGRYFELLERAESVFI